MKTKLPTNEIYYCNNSDPKRTFSEPNARLSTNLSIINNKTKSKKKSTEVGKNLKLSDDDSEFDRQVNELLKTARQLKFSSSNHLKHQSLISHNNHNHDSSGKGKGRDSAQLFEDDNHLAGKNRKDLRNNQEDDQQTRIRILDQVKRPAFYGSTAASKLSHHHNHYHNHHKHHHHKHHRLPPPPSPNRKSDGGDSDKSVSVSDIIGNFGWFQFLVLLFSGLREASVGYDAVIMSIVLQPEKEFYCADELTSDATTNLLRANGSAIGGFNETNECFRWVPGESGGNGKQRIACESWLFPRALSGSSSLVADWALVCDRHWLVAFIESAYFFGLVTGNLMWGYWADRAGRRRAYLAAHSVALVAGVASIFAPNIAIFALCRYLSAFGSIGYNIIYSIQVELIGTKYRSFSTTLNHLGWGLGVICVPLMHHLLTNYRYIIAVAPLLCLLMYPWAFWLPESSRWLMASGDYSRARYELCRAAKFNGKRLSPSLDKKISLLKQKIRNDKLKQESINFGDKNSYQLLLKNRTLVRDTIVLSFVSFTGHLFYYLLTINFGYMKNLSLEANFITSGAGEWVSVVVGAGLLKFCSRKTCMTIFLITMAASFIFQSIIDSGLAPQLDSRLIITTNNGLGTLSALLLVFVTLIVNQEVYPTVIRQTGSSIVNTLGESGSTLAPLLIQLGRLIGLWRADVIYCFVCAIAMIGIQFLTKTDDIELMDT